MKVWYCHIYCHIPAECCGWLVAAPTRGKAKSLAVHEMMLDSDFEDNFLEMRTKVWPKEIESEKPRALTEEECKALGLQMLEDWEL